MSVSEMVNRRNSVKLDEKGCRITNKKMDSIATATLEGNLCKINLNNKTQKFIPQQRTVINIYGTRDLDT